MNDHYLKRRDPIRQTFYPDEMIRPDGSVRNPDYQSNAGWIWAGVAIAAFAIVAFTFFGNDTRDELPPSAVVTTTTPATPATSEAVPATAPAPVVAPTVTAVPAEPVADTAATDAATTTPAPVPPVVNNATPPSPVVTSPDTPPSNR